MDPGLPGSFFPFFPFSLFFWGGGSFFARANNRQKVGNGQLRGKW